MNFSGAYYPVVLTRPQRHDRPNDLSYRQRWGLSAAIQHSVVERLDQIAGFHLYGIYYRPVTPPAWPGPVVPGFEIRLFHQGDEQELLACAVRPELELTADFVNKALGKGDMCAAILENGQIVYFSWTAFTPTHVRDGVYVSFADRYRYGYFAFTLAEYRGRHLPRMASWQSDRYCVEHGRTHSISYISIDNQSSMRMAGAIGNRRIGFGGYWKRGPLFIPFRTYGVREHGFRFFMPDRITDPGSDQLPLNS